MLHSCRFLVYSVACSNIVRVCMPFAISCLVTDMYKIFHRFSHFSMKSSEQKHQRQYTIPRKKRLYLSIFVLLSLLGDWMAGNSSSEKRWKLFRRMEASDFPCIIFASTLNILIIFASTMNILTNRNGAASDLCEYFAKKCVMD